jgi:hypothetical protein
MSAPSTMPATCRSGPNSLNSPTHTGALPLSQTVSLAYRAVTVPCPRGRPAPRGIPATGEPGTKPAPASRGMYIGLPGSRAMLCAPGTLCHWPSSVAKEIEARAEELELPSVIPRPSSWRTWPRSTVSVSGHEAVHQGVAASPSMALEAGLSGWDVSALAVPESAQLIVGTSCGVAGPNPWAAEAEGDTAAVSEAAVQVRAALRPAGAPIPDVATGRTFLARLLA